MNDDISALITQLTGGQPVEAATGTPAPNGAATVAQPQEETVKPVYPTADAWVREVFVALLSDFKIESGQGRNDGLKWCRRWWSHPLALDRLESLWRAWEALRLDPGTGISVWYRDHFHPALTELTDDRGPFRRCSPDKHTETDTTNAVALPAPPAVLAFFAEKAPPVGLGGS